MPNKILPAPVQPGLRFGRWTTTGNLTTVRRVPARRGSRVLIEVVCDCGTVAWRERSDLKGGRSPSCGCLKRELTIAFFTTHGGTKTRLHVIWCHMRHRCEAPSNRAYQDYGGRGVSVCPEWHDFAVFREWALANGYADGLSIDRFPNNDGNYEPGNCRWATPAQQNRNTRVNRMLTAFGETKCITDWAADPRCRVTLRGLNLRLARGVSVESAITAIHLSRWHQ